MKHNTTNTESNQVNEGLHTKGEWMVGKHGNYVSYGIYTSEYSNDIAIVQNPDQETAKANAELIVEAVNAYDSLKKIQATLPKLLVEANEETSKLLASNRELIAAIEDYLSNSMINKHTTEQGMKRHWNAKTKLQTALNKAKSLQS